MHDFPALDIQEVLHGVAVADPYRWLEDRGLPVTERWLTLQGQKADDYFGQCEGVDWLRQRVRVLLDRDEVAQPVKVGHRVFFRRRSVAQEQGCICVSHVDTGSTQVLVDPAKNGILSSALIHCVNADGSLLAFAVANGGHNAKEIYFVDTDRRRILADYLPMGRPRGIEFFPDKTGYYYSYDRADQGAGETHSIRSHRFGTDTEDDPVIFSRPRTGLSKLILLGDGAHLGALYLYQTNGGFKSDLYRAPRGDNAPWTLIAGGLPGSTSIVLRHGKIFFFKETEGHARYLECFEPGENGGDTVIPPERELQEVSIRQNYIYSHHFDGNDSSVHVWTHDGEHRGEVDVPRAGTIRMCRPLGSLSDTFFYTYESFDSPSTIFHFDPDTFTSQRWFTDSFAVRPGWCTSWKASYSAKDGTRIPITLVTDSQQPEFHARFALMTSYGGFGVSMTPQFSVLATVMLELGAIFAIPHIRGGGEGGPSWHQAAVGPNRQVAFDDFISAAEWLHQQGVVLQKRIALFGGSNSALLVAAAGTQRPDLFGVLLCIAGLFDMVRYEHFDRAGKWRPEFGSVADEAGFHALYSYSPYHNIDDSVDYPATLVVSGDQDDSCNPAHSRKIVARLQQRPAQRNPVLLDYTAYRGHSPVLPLSIRIEALTFRLAFLCRELGIDIKGRSNRVATGS